jgi:hypothetical protein
LLCFYIFVVVWFDFEVTTQPREDANNAACLAGSGVTGIVRFGVVGVVGTRFDYLVDCCVFVLSVLAPSFFFLLVVWLVNPSLLLLQLRDYCVVVFDHICIWLWEDCGTGRMV